MIVRLATALFLAQSVAAVAAPSVSAPEATLIENVQVFDGIASRGRHSVLIRDGKIVDTDYRGRAAPGVRVVDGRGKTLLPGLIDSHVHAFQGLDDPLLFGVTTQFDMFSAPQSTSDLRAAMAQHANFDRADIVTSGILATVPKGHGTEYGFPIPTLTTPAEAEAWVTARIAQGSDFIKIIDEPGTTFGRTLPTLDKVTIHALVVAAHRHGKLAVVHVQSLATATESIEAGADGLAHLFTDHDGGAAFAALARAHHVFIIPTYTVFEAFSGRAGSQELLTRPAFAGLLAPPAVASVRQSIGTDRAAKLDAVEAANITALVKAGVPILAGTDAGNPGTWYGISLHHELDLLAKAGMTPTQVLVAATSAPATAFRLNDRGRIARGLVADLVLVDGDPTADIAHVHDVVEIWKDGRSVTALREARRASLLRVATVRGPEPIALLADGRIGLFADNHGAAEMKSPFGAGWSLSTDSIADGTSKVAVAVSGSAPGGQPALVLTGVITADFVAPWAGISFSPGAQPFQPANLSAANALRFEARGTSGGFAVMGFSTAGGQRPAITPIAVTPTWTEVTVKFADLQGFDPTNAMLLLIAANQKPGAFRLEVADVRLVKVN